MAASGVKICRSGQKRVRVPVFFFTTLPTMRSPVDSVKVLSGAGPSKTPGTPRRKLITCTRPSRSTSTSSRDESALTTDAPTPWSPPEAA